MTFFTGFLLIFSCGKGLQWLDCHFISWVTFVLLNYFTWYQIVSVKALLMLGKPQIEKTLFFFLLYWICIFLFAYICNTQKNEFLFCLCAKVIRWLVPNSLIFIITWHRKYFMFSILIMEVKNRTSFYEGTFCFSYIFSVAWRKNDSLVLVFCKLHTSRVN